MKSYHPLIIIFLLSCLSYVPAQAQLSGTYIFPYGWGTKELSFRDNRFHYSHSHCTGIEIGQGSYSIKNNRLILSYHDSISNKGWKVDTLSSKTNNDSVAINFSIREANNKSGISHAYVLIKGMQYGTTTDTTGWALLKFPRSDKPVTIEIQLRLTNNPCIITIVPDRDYQVNALLINDRENYIADGTVERYQIKEITKEKFKLKGNYSGAKWELFKRR